MSLDLVRDGVQWRVDVDDGGRHARGRRAVDDPARTLPLARKLSSKIGRADFVRMRILADHAEPIAASGASNLLSTVIADGFTLVPADSEGAAPGDPVTVYLFDEPGGES